ncbi:MAG TPA: chemotaxis protein CheW [Gammaproteobacteria bacterium]
MSLVQLAEQPFELLLELERRARAAIAAREGKQSAVDEWVGIGFRLGAEHFVTGRGDVREILPVPEQITRVPGAKPWLRGIANLRGQLLTVVDLKAFLGGGGPPADRRARLLVAASRDVPTALIVDEVLGFRRFATDDFRPDMPATVIRCEHYLGGCYRRGSEIWPRFSLHKLLADEQFLNAGEMMKA